MSLESRRESVNSIVGERIEGGILSRPNTILTPVTEKTRSPMDDQPSSTRSIYVPCI